MGDDWKTKVWPLTGLGLTILLVVALSVLFPATVLAETVIVKNAPRAFTAVMPPSWTQQPPGTKNSRIKFSSPKDTPPAECSVIVIKYSGLREKSQSTFDLAMAEIPSTDEMASQLSSRYNNVTVFGTGAASISSHPAQLTRVQYSVGTPTGQLWAMSIMVTTATTPGLIWTVACGSFGWSPSEAQKAFSYWQSEIVRFHMSIAIK